jgi:hypothetical protein
MCALLVAKERDMTSSYADIVAVLGEYFEGLYRSDVEMLRRVFHPLALYACATDGSLLTLKMDAYFAMVAQRPSPFSRSDARTDQVLSIEFVGPVTALAKVKCSIRPKHFTDLLTLVAIDGRWQIISKVFHYELESASVTP